MTHNMYSPVDVENEMAALFAEVSFYQPYINGIFEGDPDLGKITVGVRTPWYDIVYVDLQRASFRQDCVNVLGLKNILKEVTADLDAAVSIQTEFGAGGPMRIDKAELAEYRKDPDEYVRVRKGDVDSLTVSPGYDIKDIYNKIFNESKVWGKGEEQ